MLVPSIFNDNLFDNWFDDDFWPLSREARKFDEKLGGVNANFMRTDVKEGDKGYEVSVELPGFSKDNVEVELKDGYLTISARKDENNDQKDDQGRFIRRECYTGNVSRSFYVGEDMTEEDIHASFANGILTLTVPKKEAKQQIEEKKHMVRID